MCENWTGITLQSLTSKVFSQIIRRIRIAVGNRTRKKRRKKKAGFRKYKTCCIIDQNFTLRHTLNKSSEWNRPLYELFIDFENTFDSCSLWRVPRWFGPLQNIVSVIKIKYEGLRCMIICGNHISDPFRVLSGVKQECVRSPAVFVFATGWMMRETKQTDIGASNDR